MTLFIQFQHRRDTAANWTSANPTLAQGELGLDTTAMRFKLGDGTTAWNTLGYSPNTVYGGAGTPSAGLGVNGDIYFDTTGGATKLYGPKAAGSWGSGVTLTGATGAPGSTGPTGPGVPNGGTTGQVLLKNSATNLDTSFANTPVDGSTITITGNNVAGVPNAGLALAKLVNAAANSVTGEFTGTASARQDQAVAANQFLARASSGNLAAKAITDPALALLGTTTLGSASAFFPKEINGVAYITAGNPQGWAGADFGAWANAAWSYLIAQYPQIGGEIRVGPGIFACSTPMILGTQFAAISLTGTAAGFGGPSGAPLGAVGGTVINYTPTTGICLTIGGTNNNGGGIKVSDIAFQGTGIGNGATAVQVGIQSGATGANAFASQAGGHWTNVTINGFTNGVTWNTASHIAYAQHFYNCHIQYCTNGLTPFGEANVMFGGLIGNCVTGILGNLNGSDFNAFGTAFDDNSTTALNISQPLFRCTLVGCRFENAGGGTDNYITQSDGSILIKGGSMQSDIVAVSTSTGFATITGGLFNLDGCWLYNSSANRTFTQIFNVSSGAKSFAADPQISPSSAAFGPLTNLASGAFPRRFVANVQPNVTATTVPLTTVTQLDSRGGLPFPANVRPGQRVRATLHITSAATAQTFTARVLFGTANTNADTQVASAAFGAGTAVVGSAMLVVEFVLVSATTALATLMLLNAGTTGVTNAAVQSQASAGLITVATTSPTFLGIYGSSATASALTVRSFQWEILAQGN